MIVKRKKSQNQVTQTGGMSRVAHANCPEVTVIIAVYNVESYINDCLKSISEQTFTDYEAIIIDDGSTDGSSKIIDYYVLRDRRFKVIKQSNCGLSSARNAGINAARGRYLCFVDGDDMCHVDMISKLHAVITETGASLAMCDYSRVEGNRVWRRGLFSKLEKRHIGEREFWEEYYRSGCSWVPVWHKMYKSEIFSNTRFAEGIIFEDSEILLRIIKQCENIAICNESLYYYRVRSGSIMESATSYDRLNNFDTAIVRNNYFWSCGWRSLVRLNVKNMMKNVSTCAYLSFDSSHHNKGMLKECKIAVRTICSEIFRNPFNCLDIGLVMMFAVFMISPSLCYCIWKPFWKAQIMVMAIKAHNDK